MPRQTYSIGVHRFENGKKLKRPVIVTHNRILDGSEEAYFVPYAEMIPIVYGEIAKIDLSDKQIIKEREEAEIIKEREEAALKAQQEAQAQQNSNNGHKPGSGKPNTSSSSGGGNTGGSHHSSSGSSGATVSTASHGDTYTGAMNSFINGPSVSVNGGGGYGITVSGSTPSSFQTGSTSGSGHYTTGGGSTHHGSSYPGASNY